MKMNHKYITSLLFGLAVVFAACEDEDAVRVPDLQTGATLRLQFNGPTYLDMENRETATLDFDLFTVNNDISEVNLYMTYVDFEEDSTYETRIYRNYSQGDFDAEGAIRNVTIGIDDIASLYGIPSERVTGGDQVLIATEMILEDGRVYPNDVELPDGSTSTNTPDVVNASTSSFNIGFQAFAACNVPSSYAVGRYNLEQISGPADAFFGLPTRWAAEEVNIAATSLIQRTFQGTYFTFNNRTFNFLLICDNIIVTPTGGGIGCSGTLTWTGASPTAGSYSLDEDGVITLSLIDNFTDDCGPTLPGSQPLVLQLTPVE